MATIRVEAVVYIESVCDPEDVCATLDGGLESALASFPTGEVVLAQVSGARLATPREIEEHGLDEM